MKYKVFLPTATLLLDVAVASEISSCNPPAFHCAKIGAVSIRKVALATEIKALKSLVAEVLAKISSVAYPYSICQKPNHRNKQISFATRERVNPDSPIKEDVHGSSWVNAQAQDWINTKEFKTDFDKCLLNAKAHESEVCSRRQAMPDFGHTKAKRQVSRTSLKARYPRAGRNYSVFASYFNFHSPFISFLFPNPRGTHVNDKS